MPPHRHRGAAFRYPRPRDVRSDSRSLDRPSPAPWSTAVAFLQGPGDARVDLIPFPVVVLPSQKDTLSKGHASGSATMAKWTAVSLGPSVEVPSLASSPSEQFDP